MLGERVRERKRIWRTPTFWVILLLAFLALLVMLLTSCGRASNLGTPSATTEGTQPVSIAPSPSGVSPGTAPESGTEPSTPVEPTPSSEPAAENPAGLWLTPWGSMTSEGLRYGFADVSGRLVIPAVYDHVRPFTAQGLAVVGDSDDNSGVIDRTGQFIVPMQQAYIELADEGPILISRYGDDYSFQETQVFDATGRQLFVTTGSLSPFREGLAVLYQDKTRGYVDLRGNMAIQLDLEWLGDFVDGHALVGKTYDGPRYYIDKAGNDATASVSDGISLYKDTATNRYGYRKPDGSLLTEPLFLEAEPYWNGTAIASVNADPDGYAGLYGLLDTNGQWVMEPIHSGIKRMRNGLLAAGEPLARPTWHYEPYMEYTYMGLYRPDGVRVVDHVLVSVEDASAELVCVSDGLQIWLVDRTGREAQGFSAIPGTGSLRLVGEYLFGTVNGISSVYRQDGSPEAILRTGADLGDGLQLVSAQAVGNRYTRLTYPVLRGLPDQQLQSRINERIADAMGTGLTDEPMVDEETGELYIETMEGDWQGWRVGRVLAVEQYPYWYPLGAAHGMPGIISLHVNLDTGEAITLGDLLDPDKMPQGLAFLSDYVTGIIQHDKDEIGYFVESVEVTPDSFYRLTKDGLELYWAPYELASYAAGFRDFLVPWADLKPYMEVGGEAWKALQLP